MSAKMNWFKKRLRKTKPKNASTRPLPSWEEIVEIMYDKNLSFVNEIVKIIYSKDKSRRFIITKNKNDLYKYQYQEICLFGEDGEWIDLDGEPLPAYWAPISEIGAFSFFSSVEEAMQELMREPTFKQFF